jgi:hypothetical protein
VKDPAKVAIGSGIYRDLAIAYIKYVVLVECITFHCNISSTNTSRSY